MSKFFLFALLWYIFGNPIIAVIVLLVIIYFLDRRFVGLLPSLSRPFRLQRKTGQLERELRLNPYDTSSKHELARVWMERRKYALAIPILEAVIEVKSQSAEARCELGMCYLKEGRLEQGEKLILEALEAEPRVKYGEPYLYLGEAFSESRPEAAAHYLEQFKELHSSSCEGYYRLGLIYQSLGRTAEAKDAFRETLEVYRLLPRYKRKQERRWALLARFRT
jgi:tetratricopeptide (TPR) repeat protein